jgi:hypothetical protein
MWRYFSCRNRHLSRKFVMPARPEGSPLGGKAGTQCFSRKFRHIPWTPACAGVMDISVIVARMQRAPKEVPLGGAPKEVPLYVGFSGISWGGAAESGGF